MAGSCFQSRRLASETRLGVNYGIDTVFNQGETKMGDKGKKDKGAKEVKKKPLLTPQEKRKLKNEKKKEK